MNDAEHNFDRQTARNYGIDALRIISMIMIVTLHVLGHGADIWKMDSGSLRGSILWLFEITALCSVNCFVLISGYVGVSSKYKLSNLIALWFQVIFYTVSFTLIAKILYPEAVSIADIIRSFFPVYSSQYWFFTCYSILYLFIPILNAAIEHIDKMKMGLVLFLIICSMSVFGLVRNTFVGGDVFSINDGYSPWWLMIVYLIGAFIRKNRFFVNVRKRWLVVAFTVSTLLTWSIKILSPLFETSLHSEVEYSKIFVNYTSATVLVSAICLLLLFSKAKIPKTLCHIIVFFTPLCFGVYLIHDNLFVRKYIISGRFYFLNTIDVPKMVLALIVIVISVFILCTLIDLVRYGMFSLLRIKPHLSHLELILKGRIKRRLNLS